MKATAPFPTTAPAPDLAAFNRLVEQHQTVIYTVAYRLLGDTGAATAATTTALTRAYQQPEPSQCPALLWLLRCLLATCGPAAGARDGLAALPMQQRQVVVLVDVAGLDYAQAGAVLDWPTPQVRARLAAARRALMLRRTEGSAESLNI